MSSTRSEVLRGIDHPAAPLLMQYKELARLHAAHGWAWLDSWVSAGRFRPEYVVGGVVSGRWATNGGGALQIPRVLRRAVVADPGWTLVVADAAQLEPRVLAALAGDRAFAEAAAAGDLYRSWPGHSAGTGARPRWHCCPRCTAGPAAKPASCSPCSGGASRDAAGYVETAARAGEEGQVVRSVLGRTCPPPSAAWRAITRSGRPDARRDPGAGAASRARGRFTSNFVVQASAADWAIVLLASLRRRLALISVPRDRGRAARHDGAAPGVLPARRGDRALPGAGGGGGAAAIGAAGEEAGRLVFGPTPVRFPLTTAVVGCYGDAK